MTTLLLRLAGPMQAWGDASRFTRRDTRSYPTKSGVLGLLAAAQGRRRADPIEDLAELRFGVRVDQPGTVIKDFQTAYNPQQNAVMPLSQRYYLADAAFLAGVEGDEGLLQALEAALNEPQFPLYLGRRSCPTVGRVNLGLTSAALEDALTEYEWLAAHWYRRKQPPELTLELVVDARPNEPGPIETRRDVPLSYDPVRREYGWRDVVHLPWVQISNPDSRTTSHAKTQGAEPGWLETIEGA